MQVSSKVENCPLCGLENACAQPQSDPKNRDFKEQGSNCWCMDVQLTQEIRDKIQLQTEKNICICKACISKFASKVG